MASYAYSEDLKIGLHTIKRIKFTRMPNDTLINFKNDDVNLNFMGERKNVFPVIDK